MTTIPQEGARRRTNASAYRLLPSAAAVWMLLACTPSTVAGLGADAAYTTAEARTTREVLDDNDIKLALNGGLIEDDPGLFAEVSTVVYKRTVYLLGTVETAAAKHRAGDLAARPEKVARVVNLLRVTGEGGLGSYLGDIVLERRIQTELLFEDDVASANYRIRSVLGRIYVIGSARSRAELDRVVGIVRSYEDVTDVETYVAVH